MLHAPNAAPPSVVHLLCVEARADDAARIARALHGAESLRQYELQRVGDEDALLAALHPRIDVVLCDFKLPEVSPYRVLDLLRARGWHIPVVVLTHAIGEEAAVHVLRYGAKDYVTKDRLATLPQVIDRVLAERRQQREQEHMAAELESALRRLKGVSARLVASQERERDLISRELHDELGQALAGMMMHLHAARLSPAAENARRHTDTALDMAQGAIDRLKALSFSLRPAQLDLLGLAATVETAVSQAAEPAGLHVEFSTRGQEPPALAANASAAVRLVQEAVENVVRHARAATVHVRLRFRPDGRLVVIVADDGIGFDKERLLQSGAQRHLGLRDMIERTELGGGRLQIRTAPGRGVTLRAVL
ncbi:histidine kinase [Ramlibacter rhizophilus]|uniref:Response regulator n=1 Tax=Ramlibacter rhizophilus TaxID=1781167 RepID=A0A4Z0BV94_9BURK|nr:histidine kinase [Ramlibacter rhizophilus]TFZ03237.1 response regulator [Ramlibacter rhizophilus]